MRTPSMLCAHMEVATLIRTYSELITIPSFEERYRYLKLNGAVGRETFGADRYANQALYTSPEWKSFRNKMIIRDNGCDMAIADREIFGYIILHHLNPITIEDVLSRSKKLFDPDNVVCVSLTTHNAIHYGDENLLIPTKPTERRPNDTCPWKEA